MSSEALERALVPECACGTKLSVCWKCYEARCLNCDPYEESDDCATKTAEAEAALAVAREREQRAEKTAERLRERWDLAHRAIRGGVSEAHYLANLRALESSELAADAALVDENPMETSGEPAAGTLAEPGRAESRPLGPNAESGSRSDHSSGSANAAADEPATGENDQWCGDDRPHDPHPWRDVFCTGVPPFARVAADEPGETP